MDQDATRLIAILDDLVELLTGHGWVRWAEWLQRDATLLRADDAEGIRHFLSAFGGMGSLNDVMLRPKSEDERFDSLKEEAWAIATTLQGDRPS